MSDLVEELAYIAIDTVDVEPWARFAEEVMAFEVVRDDPGETRLRMDSRPYRYLIIAGAADSLPVLGWGVSDGGALDRVRERVAALGLDIAPLSDAAQFARRVDGGFRFECRNGITHEVVYGFPVEQGFAPRGDVTGFVTGPGGMGHAVWVVPGLKDMDDLMIGAFGMSLREDISTPLGTGHFYGCNPRHHSLAAITGEALQIQHVMAEMLELDDVGRAMDRAIDGAYEILQPLGRHRTDHMVSFYVRTPGGFGMEVGWGAVTCGADWSEVREGNRRRPWGHGTAMRRHQSSFGAGRPT
jgi:2,3-dihydroxybiphenyl 1,2-dioxygenase